MSDMPTTEANLCGLGVPAPLATFLVRQPKTMAFTEIDASGTTLLVSGQAAVGATDAGGSITIQSGDGGTTSGTGGALTIASGAGSAGNAVGGQLSVQAGASNGTGSGASTLIQGGNSGTGATGNGGVGRLRGGDAKSDGGTGGTAYVLGGSGGVTTGSGGQTLIQGGTGAPTGRGGHVTLQGGNSGATSGYAGDIQVLTGTAAGTGKGSGIYLRVNRVFRQRAPYSLTSSATMTATAMQAGDFLITGTPGGAANANYTLPTATNFQLEFGASSIADDDCVEINVVNLSTNAAETITMVTNTGWTLVGKMVVEANTGTTANNTGRFFARRTATNTWTLYRVG